VKFEDERSVWQIMLASVREALGRFNVVPSMDFGPEGAVEIPVITGDMPAPHSPHIEVDTSFNPFDGHEYNRPGLKWKGDDERDAARGWESLFTITARSDAGEGNKGSADRRRFFQVKNRYIMCPVISGIMMIDQRRAHERVLYERYLASLSDGPKPAQVSLFPVETELNPGDIIILEEIKDEIKALGFGVTTGNGCMVTITGHPADSRNVSPHAMLETLLTEYKQTLGDPSISARERVALSMAKASAIPYGMPLTHEEMEELFDMLFACAMPNYSPTGKTVMNIITLDELDRRFS
jgi:DNA mismatch repair protein MutL